MRNVCCKYYSNCLDIAVERNLQGWSCKHCWFQYKNNDHHQVTDFFNYFLLLSAIFEPKLYKKFREEERKERFIRAKKRKETET